MTSIIFLKETFWRKEFRCNYLKNKKHFLPFFSDFWNVDETLNFYHKTITLINDVFPEIPAQKNIVR